MSFSKVKSWDNRVNGRLGSNGKSWTRRIQWMEDRDGQIKLKMEDETGLLGTNVKAKALMGEPVPSKEELDAKREYREVVVISRPDAQTIWDRFKQGQPINDCVSFLGTLPPKGHRSRRAEEQAKKEEQAKIDALNPAPESKQGS